MKMINRSGWAPRKYEWNVVPIPITNPSVDISITDPLILTDSDSLYYSFYNYDFHTYKNGGPARFYHRLAGVVLYSILDEDNYFNEDD